MSHPDPCYDPDNSYDDDDYYNDFNEMVDDGGDEDWDDDSIDDSMDGDMESGFNSCGWGTDESYGYYGEDY